MNQQIKTAISFFAAIILLLGIVGCGNSSETLVKEKADNKEVVEIPVSKDVKEEAVETLKQSEEEVEQENAAAAETPPTAVKGPAKKQEPVTQSKQTATTTTPPTTQTEEKKETKPETPSTSVTITIVGPKDMGTFTPATRISVKEGDTVLDVLLRATKDVEYRGSGATAYVEGIHNVYEFDYGAKSGWTCKLNGTTLSTSAGITKVKDSDKIDWIYIEDYSENK